MRKIIIALALDLIILVCWSVVGITRAATEASWLCLIDGAIMMAYLLMSIDNVYRLIKLTKTRKRIREMNNKKTL